MNDENLAREPGRAKEPAVSSHDLIAKARAIVAQCKEMSEESWRMDLTIHYDGEQSPKIPAIAAGIRALANDARAPDIIRRLADALEVAERDVQVRDEDLVSLNKHTEAALDRAIAAEAERDALKAENERLRGALVVNGVRYTGRSKAEIRAEVDRIAAGLDAGGADTAAAEPRFKWCQPGDRQDVRYFFLHHDDPDCRSLFFSDEDQALAAFIRRSSAWSCTLFAAFPYPSQEKKRAIEAASDA